MRHSVLAIAIAFALATPCTALAQSKLNNIKGESQDDKHKDEIHLSNPSRQVASPTTKGSTTTPAGTAGVMPGWNTCTSDACPSPLTNSKLLGSGGASGAVAGSKAKLPK
jgi:type VI secretion system (T6SS) effector Hcp